MGVAFAACVALRRRGERYLSTGLLLIGCAAFIGALRWAVNPDLDELHTFAVALATHTGLPLMAVQYLATCFGWPDRDGRMATMGASVVGFAAFGLAFPFATYGLVVGAVSLALVAAGGLRAAQQRPLQGALAAVGAVGVALAMAFAAGPTRLLLLAPCLAAIAAGLPQRAPAIGERW